MVVKRCFGNFNSIGINVKYHQSSLVNLKLEVLIYEFVSLWLPLSCTIQVTDYIHPNKRWVVWDFLLPYMIVGWKSYPENAHDPQLLTVLQMVFWKTKSQNGKNVSDFGLSDEKIHILIDKAESVFKARIINRKLKKTRGHSDTPNIRKHIKWNF